MQIAHPAVAAGVADHSDFPEEPYARLWRTLDSMLTIAFGDHAQSAAAAERVTAVHRRVRGRIPGGAPYDALDPELLLWVHATIVDSALVTYRRFVGELAPTSADRYYQEMKRQATAFEVPAAVLPRTLDDFSSYLERMEGELHVGDQARRLSRDILSPPVPVTLRPLAAFLELVTTGLLPPAVREGYGLQWSPGRDRALRASARAVRMGLPLLPQVIRRWPHARAAARRAGAQDPVRAGG
jgi:uncharacterized protein (DUF2236 family)